MCPVRFLLQLIPFRGGEGTILLNLVTLLFSLPFVMLMCVRGATVLQMTCRRHGSDCDLPKFGLVRLNDKREFSLHSVSDGMRRDQCEVVHIRVKVADVTARRLRRAVVRVRRFFWVESPIAQCRQIHLTRHFSHAVCTIHFMHITLHGSRRATQCVCMRASFHPHVIHDVCLIVRCLSLRVCPSPVSLCCLPLLFHTLLAL